MSSKKKVSQKSLDNLSKGKKFSSENQPSPEKKREGQKRKRLLTELGNTLITGDALEKAKETAQELGLDLDEIDIKLHATLVQLKLAIRSGDQRSYESAMKYIAKQAAQTIEIEDSREPPKDVLLMFEDLEKENENQND